MTERFKQEYGGVEFILGTDASATASGVSSVALPTGWTQNFDGWIKANVRVLPVTLQLPPELQQWIGKIATYWALAEWIQAGTLARVLGIGRKEARVTFGDRIGNCVSKIKQNLEIKDIPTPENFALLSALLTECERRRNLLCHGVWMVDPDTNELCVQNPSGEWTPPKHPAVSKRKYPEAMYVTVSWLEETLKKMETAIRDVQALDLYLNNHLPPSPHKSSGQNG